MFSSEGGPEMCKDVDKCVFRVVSFHVEQGIYDLLSADIELSNQLVVCWGLLVQKIPPINPK